MLHGATPGEPAEAVAAGILLAAMTGGTVLTFDASLPWVYHEVYVWAVATVVGTLYWLLRAARRARPAARSAGCWPSPLAAALTRTTGGFAVCGAIAPGRRRGAGSRPAERRPDRRSLRAPRRGRSCR